GPLTSVVAVRGCASTNHQSLTCHDVVPRLRDEGRSLFTARVPIPSLARRSLAHRRLISDLRAPLPHTKGHLGGPLTPVSCRRIGGISAPFENYMQDLGFTRIWCGHELPVNTSPRDFEVLRGLARIFNDECSLSRLELRWHVDSIVG